MIHVNTYHDLEPFAGKLIALKFSNEKCPDQFSSLYSFEDSPEIKYGVVDDKATLEQGTTSPIEWRIGYFIHYFLNPRKWYINPHINKSTLSFSLEIREATLNETNRLKEAIDSKKIHHVRQDSLDWDKLKHFSDQATLFLCGLNDVKSALHCFPKEIANTILKYV